MIFLTDFAIKMFLDYTYRLLNLLAIKCNHFICRFLSKHSNVGNKELESIFSCQSRTLCSVIWNHMLREQNKRFITRFFYSVRKNKNLYCFNKFKGTCCYLKLRLFLNQKPCMIKFLPNHKTNFRQLTSWC